MGEVSLDAGRRSPTPFTLKALLTVAGTILAGSLLAVFLARWDHPPKRLPWIGGFFIRAEPVRRAALGVGKAFERLDGVTAQWQAAGISALALAVLFGAAFAAH